jgi:hypothetical protein
MNILYGENIVNNNDRFLDPEAALIYLLADGQISEEKYSFYLKPRFSGDEYPESRIFFGGIDYEFMNNFAYLEGLTNE